MKFNKLNLIIFLFFLLITTLFLFLFQENKATYADNKPNIVFILADDLGWNDVGFHGSDIKTSNIDKLAASGVRLERFYVKATCSPTRAAFLTGRHPFRYGMSGSNVRPVDKIGLPLSEKTIAETLKQAGYYTAIIGKWHLGHYEESYLPTSRGFDYHYGNYLSVTDYFTHQVMGGLDWHRNNSPVYEEGYTTDLLGADAVKLISNHDYDKQPLFLYVAFNAPHTPYQAKEEDINKYLTIDDEKRRIHAAQVQSMDEAIGKIIKSLKERQVWNNTILVFTSDNGGEINAEGVNAPPGRSDNRPLRGGKRNLYEGGVRVPAIIVYPKYLSAGEISDQVFSIVDLYPTFTKLESANLDSQNQIDGIDIIKSILENNTNRDELLIQYKDLESSSAALIKGNYKLIKNALWPFPVPYYLTEELFDINKDPWETHNLAYSKQKKYQELEKILEKYEKEMKPFLWLNAPEMTKDFVVPDVWSPEYLRQ